MNTREATPQYFHETPSIGNLFRTVWQVIHEWVRVRMHAQALHKLDFRQLREDEITDEMLADIEKARNAPDEDFVNI